MVTPCADWERVLPHAVTQLVERFRGMNEVANLFSFLEPRNFTKQFEAEILEAEDKLQIRYHEYLIKEFPLKVINAISFLNNDGFNETSTVKDVVRTLLINYNFM